MMPMPSLPLSMNGIKGRLCHDRDLGKTLWFRAGGRAEWIFHPRDPVDLSDFLHGLRADIPVHVVGAGSNVIIRDGGMAGVVIRLSGNKRAFSGIDQDGTNLVVGAGVLAPSLARKAADLGLRGVSFLAGIPGSIGGCIRMNAGAHDHEIKDVLTQFTAIDRHGVRHDVVCDKAWFSYRRAAFPDDWIIVSATLALFPDERTKVAAEVEEIRQYRRTTQPSGHPTGGSTFLNPPGHKAWQLIAQAGCRSLRRGDAMVSPRHCNFLVNLGHAGGNDLEDLGEDIRQRVQSCSGIALEWEIERLGARSPTGKNS